MCPIQVNTAVMILNLTFVHVISDLQNPILIESPIDIKAKIYNTINIKRNSLLFDSKINIFLFNALKSTYFLLNRL